MTRRTACIQPSSQYISYGNRISTDSDSVCCGDGEQNRLRAKLVQGVRRQCHGNICDSQAALHMPHVLASCFPHVKRKYPSFLAFQFWLGAELSSLLEDEYLSVVERTCNIQYVFIMIRLAAPVHLNDLLVTSYRGTSLIISFHRMLSS